MPGETHIYVHSHPHMHTHASLFMEICAHTRMAREEPLPVKEEVNPGIMCKCECVCVCRNMQAVRKCSNSERSRELVPEILLS